MGTPIASSEVQTLKFKHLGMPLPEQNNQTNINTKAMAERIRQMTSYSNITQILRNPSLRTVKLNLTIEQNDRSRSGIY